MNYQLIYDQIIDRARNRQLDGYKEIHHIIPKCLGGSDKKENLVKLTAREHFLCHVLLCRIYPNNKSLSYALFLMSINKNKKEHQKYKVSSREYENIKTTHSVFLKQPREQYIIDKIKQTWSENNWVSSPERNNKIKQKHQGRKITWDLGWNNPERNKKIGEKNRNNNNICILQYDLEGKFIKKWNSIAEASKYYSKSPKQNKSIRSSISNCIRNKTKSALKYIWKYEK